MASIRTVGFPRRLLSLLAFAASSSFCFEPPSASAAPYTWSGGSGATWDTNATNWTGAPSDPWNGTNGPTNTATFNLTGSNSAVVSGLVTTNGLTFAPTTTGTLTLTGGTIALAGGTSAQIMNLLSGGTTGLTAASTLTIASTITSTTNFFIGGFGSTILSASNALSGTVTIGSGASQVLNPFVQVNNNDALAGAAAVVVIGGGTNSGVGQSLRLGNGVTITGRPLTLSAAGNLRSSLQVATGSTAAWNGNITGTGAGSLNLYADGLLTIGSGTDTTVTNVGIRGSGTGVMNSAITSLNKTDPGTWIINSTSNSFTANPSISSGYVSIASIANAGVASPIGSGTTINVGNSTSGAVQNWGLLRVTSSTGGSSNRPIAISGGNVGGSGGIDSAVPVGQLLTMSGSVTASGSMANFVLTGSGNGLYSGNITGTGATVVGFYKTGSGTWTLSGSNSYTGSTFVNGGVLSLGSTNALGTSGTVQFGGGTLQYGASNPADLSAKILGSGSAISIDTNGQNVTFASTLAATNTAGLTKTGAGSLILSASNAYLGTTTVNGGTLVLANAFALTSAAPTVAVNTGTLDVGGNSLTLTSLSGTSAAGAITTGVAAAVTLTATNSGNTSFAGGILNGSGAVSLVKIGAGTLTLSGSSSYSGGTQINGGLVSVANTSALGSSGSITFGGGTLQYASGNAVDYSSRILGSGSAVLIDLNGQTVAFGSPINSSNTVGFTRTGAGLLTLSGTGGYTASTTLNGGTTVIDPGAGNSASFGAFKVMSNASGTAVATIASGSVTFAPVGNYFVVGDGNAGSAGTANFSGGSTTIDVSAASSRMMIGNKVSGAMNVMGGSVTVSGTNAIYVGGDASFAVSNATGSLTISGGTMAVTGSGSFILGNAGAAANTGVVGTLNLNGGELQTIRSFTVGTTGTAAGAQTGYVNFNGGVLKPLASNATFMTGLTAANVQVGGARIDTNGYDITIGQALLAGTGTNAGGGLTKSGLGTLTLTGASTYTGATTIAGGTLALSGAANRLATATTLAFTGGTVALNGVSQTVAGLTVSDSTSAALFNTGTAAPTLTVSNAITLGGGSGTSTLLVMPQMSGSTANTMTLGAASGITVNAGGDLRLGIVGYNVTGSGNSNAQANGTLNTTTPVTLNAGGSVTLDRMVVMTGSTSSSSGISQSVGAFTMNGGRLFIDNAIASDRRLTINGNMTVTGGTMSITSLNDMALQLQVTSTNTLSPASFDRNMGIAVYGASSTLSAGVPLGRVFTRLTTVGTVTLASSTAGGNIGTLNINDGTASPGGTTVRLGSDLTLVPGGGSRDGLPTFTNYNFAAEPSGRVDVGIDANGYILDLSGNSAFWQPNSVVSGTVATQAYWQLSSNSGTGRFIANGFNFVFTNSSTAGQLNAYTNVGPNVILESKIGNSGTNNLGSGTISASSIFRYSGTAAAATPALLTAGTSIGDLEVTGSGALKILSLAGGAQNLRMSSGILDGGSNSITFAGSATISGGTVQTGTITASSYAMQAGTVSAVLAGSGVALTKSTTGTATLSGANLFGAGVTVSDGVLNVGNATALGAAGSALAVNGGTVDLRGFGVTIGDLSGAAGGTITSSSNTTATLTVGGANSTRYDGVLANSAGTLNFTKAGGGTLTLGGASTFTGTTTISAGSLTLDNALALQNSTFDTAGVASLSFGTLTAASFGGLTGSGDIDLTALAGGLTIGGGNRSSTYGGVLSGVGGLTKTGTGTFILTGSQTYAGTTTISQGTLQVGSNGTTGWLPAADVTNNGTLVFSRSGNVTFANAINGSGSVTQSGGGTLILSGSNGYTGGTLVTGTGMLQVASAAALGTGTITLQTANTGLPNTVLNLTSGMTISNPIVLSQPNANRNIINFTTGTSTLSGPITITGAGNNANVISNGALNMRLTIAGNITGTAFGGQMSFRGGTIDITGTVNMPSAGFDLNSGGTTSISSTGNVWNYTTFQASANVLRLGVNNAMATNAWVSFSGSSTGGIDLNGFSQSLPGIYMSSTGTPAARIYNSASGTSTLTFAGLGQDRSSMLAIVDGTGGGKVAVVMNSNNRTQTLASATSSYSGGTTIVAGTLAMGSANALGSTSGPLAVNGGTLDLKGYGLTVGTLSGSVGGVITSGSAGAAVALTVSSASDSTFGGAIQDGSGTVGLTKAGSGALTLAAANTYSGATTISAGSLVAGHAAALGNAAAALAVSGGTLDLGGFGVTRSGSVSLTGGTIQNGTLTNDTVAFNAQAGSISAILAGAAGLTKTTAGTVTLTGSNTYTGPTSVNAGTLVVNGSLVSDVATLVNAALGGSGSVGAISGAGLVGPGNSPGILTAPSIDPSGGLDFAFEFTQATPNYASATASDNDLLWLTGGTPFTSSLSGSNSVSIYLTQAAAEMGTLTGGFFTTNVADFFTSIQGASFQYFVQDAGGAFSYNGLSYKTLSQYDASKSVTISTVAQNGGQVMQMVVVPEPGALVLAGFGTAVAAWALRRRRG